MKAILLCAGYATRLQPLTDNCPKHLLEVWGKTILDHVIKRISCLKTGDAYVVEEIYVVTNSKFFPKFEQWRATRYEAPIPLHVIDDGTSDDKDRLGSIGDVEYVLSTEKIRDDLLIVNADNLFTFDLEPMYQRFQERANVIACYDVGEKGEASKMGVATTDAEGKVISFVEKPRDPSSTEVSIGIYMFSLEAAAKIGEYVAELKKNNVRPDTTGDFVGWLWSRVPIYVHSFSAKTDVWIDIGTPEQYEKATRDERFR